MGVIRISKKGMDPSVLVSSVVNFILGLMEFKCSGKLLLCCFLMIVNVLSTNLFQSTGGEADVMMACTSRSSINRLAYTIRNLLKAPKDKNHILKKVESYTYIDVIGWNVMRSTLGIQQEHLLGGSKNI